MFTYADDGRREPFDPLRMGKQIAGCCLCGRPVAVVGVFMPQTTIMRAAVLRLRRNPLAEGSSTGIAYGLCARHAADPDQSSAQVDAVILAAAERVVVQ